MANNISPPPPLTLLSTVAPPSISRAWLTAPHPTLPLIATCSSDKTVKIHSLRNLPSHPPPSPSDLPTTASTSSSHISTISGGHKRSIRACAWKPGLKGESIIATGSFDASVGIWRRWDNDLSLRREETQNKMVDTNGNTDTNMHDSEDEDSEDGWRFAIVLDGHESEVKSVAWSSGGNLLATCSRDKSVWIWEEVGEEEYETVAVLQEHEGDVKCVAWHPEEELVASGSYDDEVRLWREDVDDWGCVAVLRGHGSTVWAVEWEGVKKWEGEDGGEAEVDGGPRLASCSDDLTIRVWRRVPKERAPQQNRLSIIRSGSIEEEWVEETRLPQVHVRPIYSIAWSKKTGLMVSAGGDGKIIVYQEEKEGTWTVIAQVDGAHDVAEVNHVCWAKKGEDQEVIISTGEDGAVKMWTV